MNKYKCIIFDCDGVLVDSEPIGNQVLVDLANELGANINLEYAFENFKGNSFRNCVNHIAKLIGKDVPNDFETIYRQRSYTKFKEEIQPISGVKEVLEVLRIPFCVASSGPETKIKLNLEATGLIKYFTDNIFSCYKIGKWKPDPSVFIWAANTMGFEPKECLVIEDSIIGVEAAIRGGFDVFGYTAHDYLDQLPKKATKTFSEMLILPELL
ncbi:HAD family hydrolase [Winogradskyella alexanderae]|uniref:HAD-IA family hydrolase n=1 Tax=Winogradskyella alexanderae TaxID=2877123 RepID=A0ABS7XU74_9FLAO|nr:HAD-IA family hydrolase [Winogradskyella alexanderae]MCA0133578.1 HAD-IA family hydrolase [Winogradskyella alexanderae]